MLHAAHRRVGVQICRVVVPPPPPESKLSPILAPKLSNLNTFFKNIHHSPKPREEQKEKEGVNIDGRHVHRKKIGDESRAPPRPAGRVFRSRRHGETSEYEDPKGRKLEGILPPPQLLLPTPRADECGDISSVEGVPSRRTPGNRCCGGRGLTTAGREKGGCD